MKITASIQGEKALVKKFQSFGSFGEQILDDVTARNADDVEDEAKALASKKAVDLGDVVQGIRAEKVSDMNYTVTSYAFHSAYVEFGTGPQVSVPVEFNAIASKVRSRNTKGTFQKGLDNIRGWCKRHGIEENAAFPIFMAILRRGLMPRPFMYPAFIKARYQYPKDVKKALKALINKFNK